MPDEPISNSGVSPTPKIPQYGADHPALGEGEEAQGRPFSLPPEPGKTGAASPTAEKPTPMDVIREREQQSPQMPQEELQAKIEKLHEQFGDVRTKIQNPQIANQLSPDHLEAFNRAIGKTNPDMRSIAKNSNGSFEPPQKSSDESALSYVVRWINGSQETLTGALNYLSSAPKVDPASYLRLQYAVQRATQRGELFASIVGASVSGVKTIMSTQLG